MGLEPGPEFKSVLAAVYEMQLDGKVTDLDAARIAAAKLVGEHPCSHDA
jgi:hypothetical protein